MDFTLSAAIAAVGVIASAGASYGVMRASIGFLKEQLAEIKTDVKELRGESKATGERVAQCVTDIAVLTERSRSNEPTARVRAITKH